MRGIFMFEALLFDDVLRWIYIFLMILLYIVAIEIITKKTSFTIKKSFPMLTATLLFTVISILYLDVAFLGDFVILYNFLMYFFLSFYIFAIKKYNWYKALPLGFYTALFTILCTTVTRWFFHLILPSTNRIIENHISLVWILAFYGLTIPLTILLVKRTRNIRSRFNENVHVQKVFTLITIVVMVVLNIITYLANWFGYLMNSPMGVVIGFVLILFALVFLIFCIAYLDTRREQRKKETELEHLKYYIHEIEKQSIEIRRFKHDYQNILLSLEIYIKNREIEKLESFFYDKIKKISTVIEENEAQFQNIEKIKSSELKSVLINKIQAAQRRHIDITFEARDEIEDINLDVVTLVRMVGILLDNAIEAVEGIEGGVIRVCMAKMEEDVLLFVSNTCNPKTIDLNVIHEEGYSTKEKGQGMGLSNLKQFSERNSNLFVKTEIDDHQFIQTITIGGR